MAGKVSSEMLEARKLVEKGATPYAAAKKTGLTTGAITRSQWYKDRKATAAETEAKKASPLERARVLVTSGGYTAAAAAKECGISQSSISRSEWYQEYIEKLVAQFKPKQGAKAK